MFVKSQNLDFREHTHFRAIGELQHACGKIRSNQTGLKIAPIHAPSSGDSCNSTPDHTQAQNHKKPPAKIFFK